MYTVIYLREARVDTCWVFNVLERMCVVYCHAVGTGKRGREFIYLFYKKVSPQPHQDAGKVDVL